MSTGARSLLPRRSLQGLALVLVLSGLVVTVIACESLTTGTSSNIAAVAEVAATTMPATPTETAAAAEITTVEEPAPPKDGHTSESETPKDAPDLEPAPLGTVRSLWTRYEEDDGHLKNWTGHWAPYGPVVGLSRNWCRLGDTNAAVSFDFEGTAVRLVACTNPGGCIAVVTLDHAAVFNVDLYGDPGSAATIVWTSPVLASGVHHVEFAWSPYTNPAAEASIINLDAVDVIGSLVY